jgi:hypothetical protein
MSRVTIALAAGLTLLAVAIGVTLLQSPMVVARKNGTPLVEDRVATASQPVTYCQAHELLPAGTSAIRLALAANTGPRVSVTASASGHVLASGATGPGWTGRVVTVPLRPLLRAVSDATICASLRPHYESVIVFGRATRRTVAAYAGRRALPGRMWIEYLRPGSRTWASLIPETARRLGLGRALAGTWNAALALELVAAMAIVASALVLKELR